LVAVVMVVAVVVVVVVMLVLVLMVVLLVLVALPVAALLLLVLSKELLGYKYLCFDFERLVRQLNTFDLQVYFDRVMGNST
jgi:hypothetical protein